MTSVTNPPSSLADLIDKELMSIDPDSQCVDLDDADWRLIITALRRAAAVIAAERAQKESAESGCLAAVLIINELKAELAQIEAQEPVACVYGSSNGDGTYSPEYYPRWPLPSYITPHKEYHTRLLYAAPVDQTAEIEKLRGYVAGLVTWIEDEVGAELPFAIDRTALSGKEPS